ncbi:MAG: hypothetical protein E7212_09650 [Clostridium sartagoforme]|nr:hypothetical protein [Clostridium sartagoforme]
MISNIAVYNEKYLYKGIKYENNSIDILLSKISKKRRIILCSHSILIKKYNYKGNNIDRFIDNKISEDFSNRENLLFHYEIDKNKKDIYLYSIRNDNIKKLYIDAKELVIEPIQFKVKKYLKNKIKGFGKFIIFYKVNKLSHLVKVQNDLITDTIISEDINEIINYFIKAKDNNYIFIKDKNIEEINGISFHYVLDLGVDAFEKIC